MCICSIRYPALAGILILISLADGPAPRVSAQSHADGSSFTSTAAELAVAAPAHSKISSELGAATRRLTGAARSAAADGDGFLRRGHLVAVTIRTTDSAATTKALQTLDRTPLNISPHAIEVYVSADDLTALEAEPSVTFMQAIVPRRSKDVVGQGRAVHNAASWINGGFTGAGVRVGVIDYWFTGINDLLGSEVPANLVARCYTSPGQFSSNLDDCLGGGNHGAAVAESVIDLAPGVQLFIADPETPLDFQASVAWMISQGVSVIVFSQAFLWDGPGDGTSPFADSPLR
ncbi:MAG: hypothetical protein ABR606_03905, partial [Vicinamibacterales bacterium]